MVSILYDGWPLVYLPDSTASLHLLALFEHIQEGVEAHVALPGEPPAWFPPNLSSHVQPAGLNQQMRWEQLLLPRIYRKLGVDLLHLAGLSPPLSAASASVLSPSLPWEHEAAGREPGLRLANRLQHALGKGGLSQARAIFWPENLPLPQSVPPARLVRLPFLVHSSFRAPAPLISGTLGPDLPDAYALYHGPGAEADIRRLLDAWSWASGPVGQASPLVVLGFNTGERARMIQMLAEYGMEDTVQVLPPLSPDQVPQVYHSSSLIFHPAQLSPWSSPVALGLAAHRPVVAAESPLADALVGPAGYLRPAGDGRALGAALITVLVEDAISEDLSRAAAARNIPYTTPFSERLAGAYHELLK